MFDAVLRRPLFVASLRSLLPWTLDATHFVQVSFPTTKALNIICHSMFSPCDRTFGYT